MASRDDHGILFCQRCQLLSLSYRTLSKLLAWHVKSYKAQAPLHLHPSAFSTPSTLGPVMSRGPQTSCPPAPLGLLHAVRSAWNILSWFSTWQSLPHFLTSSSGIHSFEKPFQVWVSCSFGWPVPSLRPGMLRMAESKPKGVAGRSRARAKA